MARRRGQKTGELRAAGPSWRLIWREDATDRFGKTIRIRKSQIIAPRTGPFAKSKREAQRIAWAEVLSKLDQDSIRPGSIMTVSDFLRQHFTKNVVAHKKTGGQKHYEGIIENHVRPWVGALPLKEVKLSHIQQLINDRLEQGYSVQTCIHIRNVISRIFGYARKHQMFWGPLPSEGIELPEQVRQERRPLSAADLQKIIAALPSPARELTVLLSVTGMRIAEACGLTWADLDFEKSAIYLRRSFRRGEYQTLKTAGSKHPIPLDEKTLADLAVLKAHSPYHEPEHPVFAASNGSPVDQANLLRRALKPLLAQLELPADIAWHHFRHTAATLYEAVGATVSDRKKILGHATDAMALHYAHADMERLRTNAAQVRLLLDSTPETVQ